MNREIFYNINKIIERDSKVTSYKFALLRSVIEVIQDNSPFISRENDRIHLPTGLLIEKWLLYYYPILESSKNIPQIFGENKLAFEGYFKTIIDFYNKIGGFSVFYSDLKTKGIPAELSESFIQLTKSLRNTITNMPMKYIGRSISQNYYSIFKKETIGSIEHSQVLDRIFLINNFGSFSIPYEYYEAFAVLGSFINGYDSILFKWADFSVRASNKTLSFEKVVNEILKSPITERDIRDSKKMYTEALQQGGAVYCVWSNKKILKFDVDHVIPFSIRKSNDLWNLMPSDSKTNKQKLDKIPSPEIIEQQKDAIIYYWELVYEKFPDRFEKELKIALIGNQYFKNWKAVAVKQLKETCNYLITNRGYEEWKI